MVHEGLMEYWQQILYDMKKLYHAYTALKYIHAAMYVAMYVAMYIYLSTCM